MNQSIQKWWNDNKKEFTWDNFKIILCAVIPMLIGGWIFTQWINVLTPVMNKYSSMLHYPLTLDQGVIMVCLFLGMILPIYPCLMWTCSAGLYLGKATKFFKDNKTRKLVWDDIEYFVRDMPQDQRDKIKEILSSYKSKVQLRKEKLASKSWLRRNFS